MEILKCNADFGKIYYVEVQGTLHQCKLIRTEFGKRYPYYVLDIAGIGVAKIECDRFGHFNKWYHTSTIPSILYASIDDYCNHKPIMDNYGSTGNCYNSKFIEPLFKHHAVCQCGGSVATWKWDGCKAVKYFVGVSNIGWTWDEDGFHCILNESTGCYRSKSECERNSNILVVTF